MRLRSLRCGPDVDALVCIEKELRIHRQHVLHLPAIDAVDPFGSELAT